MLQARRDADAHMQFRGRWSLAVGAMLGLALVGPSARVLGAVAFDRDVAPILKRHCVECHGAQKQESGLRFDAGPVTSGESGQPTIVAGRPDSSELMRRVTSQDTTDWMPPDGPRLSTEELDVLRRWIQEGAVWPATAVPRPSGPLVVREEDRQHWSVRPLRAAEPLPAAVDHFIDAELARHGVAPIGQAPPGRLVRRLFFDLWGLPPTATDVSQFESAWQVDAAAAWRDLIDRLLASVHYGERYGRHWLDVARYADSDGQESDRDRPYAYAYRDFVIQALQQDVPFDTFVRWQLAGDEYAPEIPQAIAATGFLTAGPIAVIEGDNFLEEEKLRNRYNELDDVVATVGNGLLGLTLGCCRCHDHKYDALPTADYYRLLCAFHSGDRHEADLRGLSHSAETADGAGGDKAARDPASRTPERALAFHDTQSEPAPTWLFERANFYDRDQPVTLGFLTVLTRGKSAEAYWQEARRAGGSRSTTYQRRALADWMTDVEHGAGALLARVIVNRMWQHHFGVGIVHTPSDFGVRGDAPTHPELLEWLAADFVAHGWSLKHLHRRMLDSRAYRRDTQWDAAAAARDADNRLWWRRRPLRLEAEVLRDVMLSAAGTLNGEPFGPGFKPPIAPEAMVARNLKTSYPEDAVDDASTRRRSVYMFHKRVVPYPFLQTFDRPDAQQSCGRRDTTIVATQALALLNESFVRQRAIEMAQTLRREAPQDEHAQVEQAFLRTLSRRPTDHEQQLARDFLRRQSAARQMREPSAAPEAVAADAFADFCQSLFALNEFAYVD